ncbi:STAS domain-containing protein, partial [Amycolatopsis solani]|uniref:STAS domain-containing protein n=1 Tax=Amycolatopsis solani TaxID=3028615 RepID=UPI0025AF28A0
MPHDDPQVSLHTAESALVLRLRGEFAGAAGERFAQELADDTATLPPPRFLILDLREVSALSAAGARLLGLFAEHHLEQGVHAAAVLGGWLAGATVTTVDPGQADLAEAVSGAKLVLGAAETAPHASIPWRPISYAVTVAVEPDAGAVVPDSPALIGVTHHELAASIRHSAALVTPGRPVLWLTSPATGAAVSELLLALTTGAPLVVAPDAARTDGHLLAGLLTRHDAGVV